MILYINGNRIQLEEQRPIALTKQVNTIGDLSSRQNDYVQNVKAPLTSDNNRALYFLSSPGNTSQVPYNRNIAKLYSETGDSIINNGFAVVKKTDTRYNITIYEGIISFWKRIENISLKDVGLPNLNHLRNVTTIIDSLENDLDYRYLLADYNGNFLSNTTNLNADYLIPSAKISYIFQRIFDYAGYTFTGNIFSTDDFQNRYVTYPKSIGSTNQQTTLLHSENFTNQTVDTGFPDPSGPGFITIYFNYIFQDLISFNVFIDSFGSYNEIINIKIDGLYQFKLNGFIGFPESESKFGIYYWVNNPAEEIQILSNIDSDTNIDITLDLILKENDKVFFGFSSSIFVFGGIDLLNSSLNTSISLVTGDSIDFEEAFIDFKCTDFVKEIMWQYSLTPFASRFENSINFLTEDEKYLDAETLDWSDKFVDGVSTTYQIGYAQKNDFKYKYNNENENHNDGSILVNDINLSEERTSIQSVTYSPERFTTFFNNEELLIVKMWEKEIQDDSSIEYKDLSKRFHFLDQEELTGNFTIESDIFNEIDSTTQAKKAVFNNLNYQSIIAKYYNSTRTVLNLTKVEEVLLKINSIEATGLDLTKKYYFKQLGGDYIINKMVNYVDNRPTKFELLKINTKAIVNQPPENVPLFIEITNTDLTSCILTLDVNTNIIQPQQLQLRAVNTAGFPFPVTDQFFEVTLDNDQVIFDTNNLQQQLVFTSYYFSLKFVNTISNQTLAIDVGSCGIAPPPAPTESITITSFRTISIVGNVRTVEVNFETDFNTPTSFEAVINPGIPAPQGTPEEIVPFVGTNTVNLDVIHSKEDQPFIGLRYAWIILIRKDGVESNLVITTT